MVGGACLSDLRADCSLCGDGTQVCAGGVCRGVDSNLLESFESCAPESACFDARLSWINDPIHPWQFSSWKADGGLFSLRAEVPVFNDSTQITLTVETLQPDQPISFRYDLDNAALGGSPLLGNFRFFIDGAQRLSTSSNSGWRTWASTISSPGMHTLVWQLDFDRFDNGLDYPVVFVDTIDLNGVFCGDDLCMRAAFNGAQCIFCELPDGTDCDLGNECTTDACVGGSCVPGFANVGTPCTGTLSECMAGACDGAGGCSGTPVPDGTSCNGASGDQCQAGACVTPTWTLQTPASAPPISNGEQAMVYDEARGEVLLFGGELDGNESNATWTWDGSTWTQRFPANAPEARRSHAMVYDSVRQEVVLFGGQIDRWDTAPPDTWIWDGNNWSERPTLDRPRDRYGHAFAFDPIRGVGVLFGGEGDEDEGRSTETWLWDGAGWRQQFPLTVPQGRYMHGMAFDPNLGEVIMVGGDLGGGPSGLLGDTWSWNGFDWVQRSSLPPRMDFGLALDVGRQHIVMFGGTTDSGISDETWEWNGSAWRLMSPAARPNAYAPTRLVYDGINDAILLFGGFSNGVGSTDETWLYDRP